MKLDQLAVKPPRHPDDQVMAVEVAIRTLTPDQWAAVCERLDLCTTCGMIDGGRWCCYSSAPDPV